MKKSLMGLILIIFMSLILTIEYSLKKPQFENSVNEDLTNVVYTIDTKLIVGGKPKELKATSFHIGDGYFLTCTHGVEIINRTIRTPFGIVNIAVFGTNYQYFMDNEEIELIGKISDVSLFYNRKLVNAPKVQFQDSSFLRVGDKLLLVGNTNMQGINIKLGIVSKLRIKEAILSNPEVTAENTFVITNPTNRGDSGSPVFVIYRNKYYLVGMIYARMFGADGYGYSIKSNYLMEVVNELKKGYYER